MVRRPLKDRFPILERRGLLTSSDSGDDDEILFESIDDLPDSPMLREFVENQAEHLGISKKEVMNSEPTLDYMRELGVLEQALEENQ